MVFLASLVWLMQSLVVVWILAKAFLYIQLEDFSHNRAARIWLAIVVWFAVDLFLMVWADHKPDLGHLLLLNERKALSNGGCGMPILGMYTAYAMLKSIVAFGLLPMLLIYMPRWAGGGSRPRP